MMHIKKHTVITKKPNQILGKWEFSILSGVRGFASSLHWDRIADRYLFDVHRWNIHGRNTAFVTVLMTMVEKHTMASRETYVEYYNQMPKLFSKKSKQMEANCPGLKMACLTLKKKYYAYLQNQN